MDIFIYDLKVCNFFSNSRWKKKKQWYAYTLKIYLPFLSLTNYYIILSRFSHLILFFSSDIHPKRYLPIFILFQKKTCLSYDFAYVRFWKYFYVVSVSFKDIKLSSLKTKNTKSLYLFPSKTENFHLQKEFFYSRVLPPTREMEEILQK